MKKIFLTSGVILCMACPAMATTDIAADANSSSCVNDVLGSYTGPVSFEAKWLPKVSGAITLNSDLYRSNEANASPVYTSSTSPAVSAATQTPLYSVYGVGLYTTQVTSTNYTNSTPVTTLNPKPSLTGHTFTGFYTDKASNGTQVIDGNGNVLPAALVQISTAGNTATWYAGYDPHISGAITLDSSVYPNGDDNSAATYATSGTSELVTASNPTSLYSVYGVNLYSSAVTLQNYGSATPTTQITVPSKVGYNFLGFYTAKYYGGTQMINDSGVVQAAAKSQITGNNDTATWYAHWGPKYYSVTYAPGDHCSGAGRTDATGLTYDQDYEVLGLGTVVNKKSGVDVPTGYTFNGWVENISGSDTNNTRQPGYTYSPWKSDGALVLTANCTANPHTITYTCGTKPSGASEDISGNTGSGADLVVNKAYDESFTLETIPGSCALSGYHFAGWKCDYTLTDGNQYSGTTANYASTLSNDTYSVTATGTFKVDANVTCEAMWAPNTIGLTWYTDDTSHNGTVISGATPSCTYDAGLTLPAEPDPDQVVGRSGYHFNGWKVRTNSQSGS